MYCFEFYNCTKAQLEKRKIYGAIEENQMIHTLHIKRQKVFDSSVMIKNMIEIPLIDRPISATIYQMHTLLEKKEILFGGAVIAGKN